MKRPAPCSRAHPQHVEGAHDVGLGVRPGVDQGPAHVLERGVVADHVERPPLPEEGVQARRAHVQEHEPRPFRHQVPLPGDEAVRHRHLVPRSTWARASADPINPAPPVIKMRMDSV